MFKQKVYFPNLNGLRFIAASLVIILHVEQFKSILQLPNCYEKNPFISVIGPLGVVLFFVLSGFLITYLLLAEEQSFKAISIRNFYVRRILRIWPLYFFIVILAFLILPNIHLFTLPGFAKADIYSNLGLKLLLYAVFFPNLAMKLLGVVPYVSHAWSVGTEEQFYLVWPVLLKHFKKYRLPVMLFIIFFYVAFAELLGTHYINLIPYKYLVKAFWSTFNIDCMAIGGIYAILFFEKRKILKVLMNNTLFYGAIVLVICLLAKGVEFPHLHFEIYSVLFGIIILNFAANDTIKISLENKALTYLGNISYGIYMYHPIGIVLAITISRLLNSTSNFIITPLSFLLTILIAGLSYKYFETFFLKYKNRFSNIISGSATAGTAINKV